MIIIAHRDEDYIGNEQPRSTNRPETLELL